MSLEAIAALLTQKIGLDPASVGSETIAGAIRRRMADSGFADTEDYGRALADSQDEWQRLVDAVVIPETWFFRDGEPFVFLAQWVLSEWLPAHRDRALRVLSVPCSSGEESYSIAMALLDAGLAPQRFRIDAMDISREALAKAATAAYGENSFRGERIEFRDRYFECADGRYLLAPHVKETVRFIQGNLLDDSLRLGRESYDVLFCRNLLIYFSAAARERAVAVFDRLLAQDGVLFAGHAETQRMLGGKFTRAPHPRAFAYRRNPPPEAAAARKPTAPPRWKPSAAEARRSHAAAKPVEAAPPTANRPGRSPSGPHPTAPLGAGGSSGGYRATGRGGGPLREGHPRVRTRRRRLLPPRRDRAGIGRYGGGGGELREGVVPGSEPLRGVGSSGAALGAPRRGRPCGGVPPSRGTGRRNGQEQSVESSHAPVPRR